jgi:hypothetical protein
MNIYGGAKHSFTHPRVATVGVPALQYDERTDLRSWRDMVGLLEEVFGRAVDDHVAEPS